MATISVDRVFDAPADRIRPPLGDVTASIDAAGLGVEPDIDRLQLTIPATVVHAELAMGLRDDDGAMRYRDDDGGHEPSRR